MNFVFTAFLGLSSLALAADLTCDSVDFTLWMKSGELSGVRVDADRITVTVDRERLIPRAKTRTDDDKSSSYYVFQSISEEITKIASVKNLVIPSSSDVAIPFYAAEENILIGLEPIPPLGVGMNYLDIQLHDTGRAKKGVTWAKFVGAKEKRIDCTVENEDIYKLTHAKLPKGP